MVFSEMWESHLRHLEEVFKWLQDVDLKTKCSKCEFFKSKVHYLGYLVGTNSVQPLIQALEPPRNRGIVALLRPSQVLQEVHPILC